MSKITTAMCLFDIHVPYHDKDTISIFKKVFKDLQPDHFVIGGDAVDAEHLGRWTEDTVEDGIYATLAELEQFRDEVYEPIVKLSKNKKMKQYWVLGNHEFRISEALKTKPERKKLIDLPKMFPDVKIKPYKDFFKIGKLCITHGEYHNDAHAKKHASVYMSNVLYGHLHTVQSYTLSSKGRDSVFRATSAPCACTLAPSYLKGGANSWTHGFVIVSFDSKGNYWMNVIEVHNGMAIVNGKIYNA